jgi:hypothetical protein
MNYDGMFLNECVCVSAHMHTHTHTYIKLHAQSKHEYNFTLPSHCSNQNSNPKVHSHPPLKCFR